MTPEECRLVIPQYLSGDLTLAETAVFEEQLAASPALRLEVEELRALWDDLGELPQPEPSAALRARFYQRLNKLTYDSQQPAAKTSRFSSWKFGPLAQLAAGLLIFASGLYLGRVQFEEHSRNDEMAQMRTQVQGLREMVALSLLERQSATSRLQGVSWSSQVDRPNSELLSALLLALNHDANVNVRLSSLDALEKFTKLDKSTQNAALGQALVDSIQSQDSPLVQIALIDSLVHIRNRSAAPELKKLTTDTTANPAVRQRAQWGLQRLNYE